MGLNSPGFIYNKLLYLGFGPPVMDTPAGPPDMDGPAGPPVMDLPMGPPDLDSGPAVVSGPGGQVAGGGAVVDVSVVKKPETIGKNHIYLHSSIFS